MKVLVDTSVWSLALRRSAQDNEITEVLSGLIRESMVVMTGPIRQEVLSGISSDAVYNELKAKLRSFDDLEITTTDYETAAEFYNTCRKNGVQGSHIDFLICAVAHNYNLLIFTTDKDFQHYAQHLPIRLYGS